MKVRKQKVEFELWNSAVANWLIKEEIKKLLRSRLAEGVNLKNLKIKMIRENL